MKRNALLSQALLVGAFTLAGASTLTMTGCEDEPDDVEDVVDDIGDAAEDAADEVDDAIDDIGDEIDNNS